MTRRAIALTVVLAVNALPVASARSRTATAEWVTVDYGEIVDRRQPTHSGEPVGVLIDRLDGRILPRPGERPQDRLDHSLLDPWTEPYAFVLVDAIEALDGAPDRPYAELAWRWSEGEAQPAWVELLRARRYVVETDGSGRVRAFLPVPGDPPRDPDDAAKAAWDDAWPILRHVLETVRREQAPDGAVRVEAYPYLHRPERSAFLLGMRPLRFEVDADVDPPPVPALALEPWTEFLESGWTLEGARLDPDGAILPFGADRGARPTLLGHPITLADLAVAYRAVFHGGLAQPYMSLDRGFAPETAVVNYGGRLRDTRIGEVALRCDVRFKTFSVGVDVLTGHDMRRELREQLPGFRTHLERFAADPAAGAVLSQQTRLWFYPDDVDLTLSEEGDVLAFRNVRMTAASERLAEGGVGGASVDDPPWTRATVAAINAHYDVLAAPFPELRDLDQVVRLLALFSWLRLARDEGLPLPDLDALLTVELPRWSTPRRFPQLLTFNALPSAEAGGSPDGVFTLARADVQAALDRLRRPDGAPLSARRRFRRALARLDPAVEEQRRLRDEMLRYDSAALDDVALDFLAYRAERLEMHGVVLSTLQVEDGRQLASRVRAGENLRVFSVAIGGLDLGLTEKVGTARRRSHGLAASASARPPVGPPPELPPARPTVREEATALAGRAVPTVPPPRERIERTVGRAQDGSRGARVVADPLGPGARLRSIMFPEGGASARVVRHEAGRTIVYRVEPFGDRVRIRSDKSRTAREVAGTGAVPEGLAVLRVDTGGTSRAEALLGTDDPDLEGDGLRLLFTASGERHGAAEFQRAALRRILLGPALDRGPGPVDGLEPLPAPLGDVERLLVQAAAPEIAPPWEAAATELAPEEDPARLAAALAGWYDARAGGRPEVAVGVRPDAGERFVAAPAIGRRPFLLVPAAAFDGAVITRDDLLAAWPLSGEELPRRFGNLVVVLDDGPPDRLAARVADLAADPRLAGRLLAVVAAGAAVRTDLPARLLEAGELAGVALLSIPPTEIHRLPERIRGWAESLARAGGRATIADLPDGPLWYF